MRLLLSSTAATFGLLGLQLLTLTSTANGYALYNDTTARAAATASQTQTAADGTYTGLGAYDPLVLNIPALPPTVNHEVAVTFPTDPNAANYQLSKPQKGNFLGFSIELSVAATLLGTRGELIKPTFLNYMDNLRQRAKAGPVIRVGGNSQEGSTLFVDGLPNEKAPTDKYKSDIDTPTATPVINYSINLFYLMANISSLVDAEWFFGLAFNQTSVETHSPNIPLAAHKAQTILGGKLRGLAMGNEPDLYAQHTKRNASYTVWDYQGEFNEMREFVEANGDLPNPLALVGPSVCCDIPNFNIWDVLNTGWMDQNTDYVSTITVQHYPTNNCKINGVIIEPNSIFASTYLTHESAINLTWPYLDSANRVMAAGKEMVMLEFNTASCGGFPGLSDSFGAALWLTDWSLQLAWGNFSNALMHVGGQNVYYNPFTPPDWTRAGLGWSTGAVYYSSLIVAEALGPTNNSQIVDYFRGREDDSHPVYLIYENGVPARAVLMNYLSDTAGGGDYTATISVENTALDHVNVRYFTAPTIVEKYDIKWAGQSMGPKFSSDGRLVGDVTTVTVPCTDGKCRVSIPGPSLAIVFLNDDALDAVNPDPNDVPFTTTLIAAGGLAIDKYELEYGNGMNPSPNWRTYYSASVLQVQARMALMSTAVVFTLVLGW